MAFNHESTTDDVISGIDVKNKRVVVTGASAGLGIETCRVLAGAGARVTMLARDNAKLMAAYDGICEEFPDAFLGADELDLADLDSIRSTTDRLLRAMDRIDILINNAGVMACPQAKTKDGFELQFGTNHLGHFLFTCRLVPLLLAGAPARVVNLSSAGHRFSAMDFDDPNFETREYDKWVAYGQSKTANALFSVGLNTRLADRGVTANAVHPGMIVTELGRHLDQSDIEALQARASSMTVGFKTIPQGAATSVWAATSPELEGRGGLYLEDCHIAEPATDDSSGGVHDYALDPDAAERLWELSEQLVGETFSLEAS